LARFYGVFSGKRQGAEKQLQIRELASIGDFIRDRCEMLLPVLRELLRENRCRALTETIAGAHEQKARRETTERRHGEKARRETTERTR
jgi:hypothetical protein